MTMHVEPLKPVHPAEPLRPAGPVLLDYAAPSAPREFRTPIAIKLFLLMGAVAVFVPFAAPIMPSISPLDTTLFVLDVLTGKESMHSGMESWVAVGLALEMALFMVLLTWVPQN